MAINHSTAQSVKPLQRMFSAIPKRYDLINHVITLGMDKNWRKKAALTCLYSYPARILDICCGTGDLTISIAQLTDYSPEIIGVDYSQPMLELAEEKAALLAKRENIKFMYADVSQLPFLDNYFDCVGVSFAFRNLTYKNPLAQVHLGELLRVLKPGGEYIIVESSQPRSSVIRKFYHLYLCYFVFPVGFLISGNKAAYHYLAESAAHFYSAEEVQDFLMKAGFKHVSFQRLFLGAAAIYTAIK